MTRTEKTRSVLSDWRFWITLSFFGLGAVVVALYFAFGKIAHEEAFRAAGMKAANATQVGQCFTAVKNAPLTKEFIAGQQALIHNSQLSTEAALDAQPDGPLTSLRLDSLARLRKAAENVVKLRDRLDASTPTRRKCVDLAQTLHVDATRYLKDTKGTP